MLDFLSIIEEPKKVNGRDVIWVSPDFRLHPRTDLLLKGKDFYAVWDADNNIWSRDEIDAILIIDGEICRYCNEKNKIAEENGMAVKYVPRLINETRTGLIDKWHKYVGGQARDDSVQLDCKVTFADEVTEKKDYASIRLPYSLREGECPAYDEIMDTLYGDTEREKLEWGIGSVLAGDSVNIQKFFVLYGPPGTGKSTIIKIIDELLFKGYTSVFEVKSLIGNSQFPLEAFRDNPLVAVQHDGKMDKIETNTVLNSLVSHETVTMNVKNKSTYPMRVNSMLFLGTNNPVKITDAKSGILRRLIDVKPTGVKIPVRRYNQLFKQVEFEIGAVADKCLKVYQKLGKHYYDTYIAWNMMSATNDFYDFVEYNYFDFSSSEYVTAKDAWTMYKTYCDMADVPSFARKSYQSMREEFKEYFKEYHDSYYSSDGRHLRSVYVGFETSKFTNDYIPEKNDDLEESWLTMNSKNSTFDIIGVDYPAQLASISGTPKMAWSRVNHTLSDIDTHELHYVKVPINHIVIDFDMKDGKDKSFKKNFEAASKWPPTYAEVSKSGAGIHLHYIYTGDPTKLSKLYDKDIEVKVFTGNSSLRRKLTRCNGLPIAQISEGLPFKEEKNVVYDEDWYKEEKKLDRFIRKCLAKEHHHATKPEIDYIYDTLEKCYNTPGYRYDVRKYAQAIWEFASKSTNKAQVCLDIVGKMHFMSKDLEESEVPDDENKPIAFFDCEVFPNYVCINWKIAKKEGPCVRMINPSPIEVTELINGYRLIGYNCRRYDNHILYALTMAYNNMEIYKLSSRLVSKNKAESQAAMFLNAMNLSYLDLYDCLSKKQSLKKWEIELGFNHLELGLDWNEPVPEELWYKVAEYCDNDVLATEAVFYSDKGQADYLARQIIAKLSGLLINDTTNKHSTRIIFGTEKHPQSEFVYTDLATEFPGYKFGFVDVPVKDKEGNVISKSTKKVSSYLDVPEVGEGGYVYARPGMYWNVWTFDIASMHPSSIIALNAFGDRYTARFKELKDARLYIKHGEFDKAAKLFDGKLAEFLTDKSMAKNLSDALKIVINSIYGLTSATFDNPFKDPRNVDNIVAKRGALFMISLRNELQAMGIEPVHIKTDSIKIENPTEEIKEFIYNYGRQFGYEFEVEHIYERICLVNDAVYIAYDPSVEKEEKRWDATGAQFRVPYVYKTLFSKQPILFEDMCEMKSVQTAIHLDFDGDLQFVGKTGQFCPIQEGHGGGTMVVEREGKNGEKKYNAVSGTKGYKWLESAYVKDKNLEPYIDQEYYRAMVDDAWDTIKKYGDPEEFTNIDVK